MGQQINIEQLKIAVLQTIMPVGSLYMNKTDSTNPATLFGFGTWVRIQDEVIMAAGSTYPAGTNGGAATHSHGLSAGWGFYDLNTTTTFMRRVSGVPSWSSLNNESTSWSGGGTTGRTNGMELGGSTDAGSSLPPYRTAYVWERTA